MLGDECIQCGCKKQECSCPEEDPQPCLPCGDGECEDWVSLYCSFWKGAAIAGTPIKKDSRGTEIVLYLIKRIKELEARVTELEG